MSRGAQHVEAEQMQGEGQCHCKIKGLRFSQMEEKRTLGEYMHRMKMELVSGGAAKAIAWQDMIAQGCCEAIWQVAYRKCVPPRDTVWG